MKKKLKIISLFVLIPCWAVGGIVYAVAKIVLSFSHLLMGNFRTARYELKTILKVETLIGDAF